MPLSKRQKREKKKRDEAKMKAKRARTNQMLPLNIKDIIAESIHQAVTEIIDAFEASGGGTPLKADAKMKGRCLYYATAAWYLTGDILGQEFELQMGSLGVGIGNEQMMKIDFEAGGMEKRSFHMWIARDTSVGVETVDLTSRFFKDWTTEAGHPWDRADLPNYLWDSPKAIISKHDVWYKPYSASAQAMLDQNEALIDAIRAHARQLVQQRLTSSS